MYGDNGFWRKIAQGSKTRGVQYHQGWRGEILPSASLAYFLKDYVELLLLLGE